MSFSLSMGKRLHYFRTLRNMTQKQLGMAIGFSERTADVRISQYEIDIRTPKKETAVCLANNLNVSPAALSIPKVEDETALLHLLFSLEDSLFELPESSKQPLLTALIEWQRIAQKQKKRRDQQSRI